MASGSIISWQIDGETMETVTDFILGAPKSLQMVTAAMRLKVLAPWKKSYDQPRQHIKKQRCYFTNKGPSNEYSGLISFRIDWFDLLAVQGTLKRVFSNTTVQKHQFSSTQLSL